jgi:hypothetical protein
MEHQGTATVVTHSAVFGRSEKVVLSVRTGKVEPYAQHARSVEVCYVPVPRRRERKRREEYFHVTPGNIDWYEILVDGKPLWNSLGAVPVDANAFEATERKFSERRAALRAANGYPTNVIGLEEWAPPRSPRHVTPLS